MINMWVVLCVFNSAKCTVYYSSLLVIISVNCIYYQIFKDTRLCSDDSIKSRRTTQHFCIYTMPTYLHVKCIPVPRTYTNTYERTYVVSPIIHCANILKHDRDVQEYIWLVCWPKSTARTSLNITNALARGE